MDVGFFLIDFVLLWNFGVWIDWSDTLLNARSMVCLAPTRLGVWFVVEALSHSTKQLLDVLLASSSSWKNMRIM
jgi:hypothetical protein